MSNEGAQETEGKRDYEQPELTSIGRAADVILGMPGGGFDGPFGMSECEFEFQDDDSD